MTFRLGLFGGELLDDAVACGAVCLIVIRRGRVAW